MLGRSVTFRVKAVEKRPQQQNFFNLTTLNVYTLYVLLRNGNNEDESDDGSEDTEDENQGGRQKGANNPESRQSAANPEPYG